MALFRAIESHGRVGRRLFQDPFAYGFLRARYRWVVRLSRAPVLAPMVPWVIDRRWPGPRGAGIMRTRYIDDALSDALREGLEQVVILGAGFDCRAYRIAGTENTRVFEVDHPATQAFKKARIQRILGALPHHVVFVPTDFNRERLRDVMSAHGYRTTARTFSIWEGVTNYLTAEAVDATLAYLAGAAPPGSRVVFTYVHRGILDGSATFAGAEESIVAVRRVGEPFTFGFHPAELPEYLAARGLTLMEDVSAPEYRERYLDPLGRTMRVSEFYHAVLARVS